MLNLLTRSVSCSYIRCSLLRKSSDILRMPKVRNYIFRSPPTMRRIPHEKRMVKSDGPAYLQFVGSGADGAPRSLYFFSEYNRYIFNVGEGTQRIANEFKVKIAKLEHVFITQPVWENLGGLPGMALTVQECGVNEITLHGPQGIDALFVATERFVALQYLKINMANCIRGKSYDDPIVNIMYVPLQSDETIEELERNNKHPFEVEPREVDDTIDYYEYLKKKGPNQAASSFKQPKFLSRFSMAYICRLKPKLGHLNLEACVERNVPPGPLLGKLKAGENVTLPDGSIVKAVDVKGPDEAGSIFIVVDCPSERFLDSLINETLFKCHQDVKDDTDIPRYIIHFTPSNVMNTEKYQRWMKMYHNNTLHVNANDNNKCLGSVGVHDLQYRLNLVDSEIFPLLKDTSIPIIQSSTRCLTQEEEIDLLLERAKRRVNARTSVEIDDVKREQFNYPDEMGHTLRLLPLRSMELLSLPDCLYMDVNEYIKNVKQKNNFDSELEVLREKTSKLNKNSNKKSFPRVTFLGTGSCIPNKTRNTSSILVSLGEYNHIIMDCGEGTYGQLVRHFGVSRAHEILAHTNIIFISHLHADHHLGLITLLKKRRKVIEILGLPRSKVLVTAPHTMQFWFNRYNCYFEPIYDCFHFISNKDLEYRSKVDNLHSFVKSVAPLEDYTTSYVVHCPHSFGVSFTDLNGYKITYSGDTMPSKDLIVVGMNSSLLIHEATFEEDLITEANLKLHSTFHQAIRMGKDMDAKFTILTHFSQRYAKIPLIDEKFNDKVGVSFDNMEVTLEDLPKLPLFYPIFKVIFEEEIEDMLSRQCKRKRTSLLSDRLG